MHFLLLHVTSVQLYSIIETKDKTQSSFTLNNQMPRIVITGAAGEIGSAVAKNILSVLSPSSLILAVHSPDNAPKWIKNSGATIRKVDYADPLVLDHAFKGANVVLLVSYPSIQHQERFQVSLLPQILSFCTSSFFIIECLSSKRCTRMP